MKFSGGLTFLAIFASIATFQLTFTSCNKDNEIIKYDTVTVRDTINTRDTIIKKDTVNITDTINRPDTAITLELLTSTAWKFQEIRGINNNKPYYYLRGGMFNTQSFDHEHILFKTDNTGVYTDEGGTDTPLTWNFANASNTVIAYNIPFPNGLIKDTIEHVTYKNGALRFGEYFTEANGISHAHSEAIRIPLNATTAANLRLQ